MGQQILESKAGNRPPTTPSPSPTPANSQPYPAALASGHPFVQEIDPPTLAAAPWMPTTSGYIYEADVYFSTFGDWPAFWMYGNNWPPRVKSTRSKPSTASTS